MLYLSSYIFALLLYSLSLFNFNDKYISVKRLSVSLAIICHALLIYYDVLLRSLNFDFSNALLVVSIITVFFYLIFNIKMHHKGLEKIIIIPTIGILIFHSIFSHEHAIRNDDSIYYLLHIGIAILGYGLLTYSAFFSIFIMFLEKNLHRKKLSSFFSSENSLLGMEKFLFFILGFGFILLTITIFTGVFFSNQIFGQPFIFNHKTFFGITSWIFYAYVLYQRFFNGLRGKKALHYSLTAFILLVLSYFGSKFVIEYLLN